MNSWLAIESSVINSSFFFAIIPNIVSKKFSLTLQHSEFSKNIQLGRIAFLKEHKTGFINDPLIQTHGLTSSEHCFHFFGLCHA